MKDLKHLIYFENLLQEAHNELVTQAISEGMHPLGYNCYYIPETLLNLPGCFSSRLRAPRCVSTDIASYYMTTRNCPYVRSILERAIEGGYNYLEALFGAESCAAMERMEEHFVLIHPVKNEKFFSTIIDYRANTSDNKKWRGNYRINIPNENNQYFDSQRKSFNNLIACLEETNAGYHFDWDETKLKK